MSEGVAKTVETMSTADASSSSAAAAAAAAETGLAQEGWYYQLGQSNPTGPLTLIALKRRFVGDSIDGVTPVWSEGMTEWKKISEFEELKSFLTDGKALPEAVPRPATADVPVHHTYTDEKGTTYIFDVTDQDWKTLDAYETLLTEDGVTEGVVGHAEQEEFIAPPSPLTQALLDAKLKKEEKIKEKEVKKKEIVMKREELEILDPEKAAKAEKRRTYRQRRALKKQAGVWLSSKNNPNVYVSGLPADVTTDELCKIFVRAGVFKIDPDTSKPKVRIYTDERGVNKGDATVSYAQMESVELAVKQLHEYEIRPGTSICVQQASFEQAGKEEKLSAAELKKLALGNVDAQQEKQRLHAARAEQKRLLSAWDDDFTAETNIMVLKNAFDPEAPETFSESFYSDLCHQLKEIITVFLPDATKLSKITPIQDHPQGIVCIKFKDTAHCEMCIETLRDKEFQGRRLDAFPYDGKTNYAAQIGGKDRRSPTPKRRKVDNKKGNENKKAPDREEEPELNKQEEDDAFDDMFDDQSSDDDIAPIRTE